MRQPWRYATALALTALLALSAAAPSAHAAEAAKGWLGVTMQPLSAELRDGLGYSGDGVLVGGVESDGPADRAGVRKGDVIVSFNSRNVTGTDMLTELVGGSEPGKTASLGLWRHGARQTLSVKLGTRPADAAERMRSSGDETWEAPTPPRAPMAPTPPSAPEAPRVWFDHDMQGLPELKRSLAALNMAGMGRGRLGVSVQDLDSQLGEYFGVADGKGVLVSGVTDDTPASRAGFKAGDVIVKVGDRSTDDSGALRDALRERPAGKVDVTVLRKGQRVTLTPTLEEPAAESWKMADGWKQAGPGEWHYKSPSGEKRMIIHRSGGDDDGDVHIIEPRSGRRVIIRHDSDDDGDIHIESPENGKRIVIHHDSGDDSGDRAEMQKQIDELQKQVEDLRQQMAKPTPKPSTTTKKKTTTK